MDLTQLQHDADAIVTSRTLGYDQKIRRLAGLATEALHIMESHRPGAIGDLPVLDDAGRLVGVVALKDLLRAGIV